MIWVILLSLAIRVPWAAWASITPLADFAGYDNIARGLLTTGEFRYTYGPAFRTPGYPLFLASIYATFGLSCKAVGLVQAVMGGFTSGLIVLLARKTLSLRTALLAGILHALSFTSIAYVPVLASENLAVFLLLGSLLALASSHQATGTRRILLAAASGGLFCSLLLTRPAVATLTSPVFMLLTVYHPHLRKWSLRIPVFFVLAAGLVFSPWSVRNYRLGMSPLTVSTQGGLALWWEVRHHVYPGSSSYTAGTEGLSDQERDVVCRKMAIEWIRTHTRIYLEMCRARLARALGASVDGCAAQYMYPSREDNEVVLAYIKTRRGPPENVPSSVQRRRENVSWRCNHIVKPVNTVLSPLILAGILLSLPRWRAFSFSLLPALSYLGILIATVFIERYRLPSNALLLIPLAALLADVFTGTRDLGTWLPRAGKAAFAGLLIAASLYAHMTNLATGWYRAPPVCYGSPDVSGLEFKRVPFPGPAESYSAVPADGVSLSHADEGLRCDIIAEKNARTAGIRFPVLPPDAIKLDISLVSPDEVLSLNVSALDESGRRVHRWLWHVSRTPWDRDRRSYAFVPGQKVRYFVPTGSDQLDEVSQLKIVASVRADSSGGFVLHRAETAPWRPAAPSPGFDFTVLDLPGEPSAYGTPRNEGLESRSIDQAGQGLCFSAKALSESVGYCYGGLRFKVPRMDAFRMRMRFENPGQITRVLVDAYTATRAHLARWSWVCNEYAPPSSDPVTLTFVPWQNVGFFTVRSPDGWFSDVRELRVYIVIAPGQEAGMVIESLELGTEKRSPAPQTRPASNDPSTGL